MDSTNPVPGDDFFACDSTASLWTSLGDNFYLRDRGNGDYWSASWQPVGKSLDEFQSTCRHGTAYTIIDSNYSNIATESTCFVPHRFN